jgi:hypothetical protein
VAGASRCTCNDRMYLLRVSGQQGQSRPSRRVGAEMLAIVAPDDLRLYRLASRTAAADLRYSTRHPPTSIALDRKRPDLRVRATSPRHAMLLSRNYRRHGWPDGGEGDCLPLGIVDANGCCRICLHGLNR